MPKEPLKEPLIDELRRIFDALVGFHVGKELKSARFMRAAITSFSPTPSSG